MRIDHGLLKQFLLLPETATGEAGGEVSASGLFAAGQNPGDYPTALEVRIYKKFNVHNVRLCDDSFLVL